MLIIWAQIVRQINATYAFKKTDRANKSHIDMLIKAQPVHG